MKDKEEHPPHFRGERRGRGGHRGGGYRGGRGRGEGGQRGGRGRGENDRPWTKGDHERKKEHRGRGEVRAEGQEAPQTTEGEVITHE